MRLLLGSASTAFGHSVLVMASCLLCSVLEMLFVVGVVCALTYSSKMIHRFSDEVKSVQISRNGADAISWPTRGSMAYYQMLLSSDLQRHSLKRGVRYQSLFPSEGGDAFSCGNDFGWLYYTWVDIGTPNVSFLVALDAGSDLFWVPCDCIRCASLSASYKNLGRDFGVYSPSKSSTSKGLSCMDELCDIGASCKSSTQSCTYDLKYYSENTSTTGVLVEDVLHLRSSNSYSSAPAVRISVVMGCGRQQSGGFLDGIAPDGLLGLGLGRISVPRFLAKTGLVHDSFSICFKEDSSGRIVFGDQGLSTQQSTPFLTLGGNYDAYIIGVESFCVGVACLKHACFRTLIDSGTSFTFLPRDVYTMVTKEFHRQINTSRVTYEGSPWDYCYKASSLHNIPSLVLNVVGNSSFIVQNPIFSYYGKEGDLVGFCLALQPTDDEDIGTVGQNLMTGYRMVFDRENLKLGWSSSNCHYLSGVDEVQPHPPSKPLANPLPSSEQQSTSGVALSPAIAGRTPLPSCCEPLTVPRQPCFWCLLLLSQILKYSLR